MVGPKKADSVSKTRRPSQNALVAAEDQEHHQCVGKFAADVELCCREPTSGYPVNIPVYIRGRPPPSLLIPSVSQQLITASGGSIAPSVIGGIGEEPALSQVKRLSRGRISSISHSGVLAGNENDNKSSSTPGQEPSKASSSDYKTFHLMRDSDFFRPKLLVDSTGNENEPIDQISSLYMRAWQLDQRFMDILKKTLPLQEHLHSLNFAYVGLNEQTIYSFAEVCQSIKNLKSVSLDGNPLAAEHFHILIEKDDLKIAHLSLRFCKITNRAAAHLAHVLGNMSNQNWKLLTLALTGNQIGDDGAKSFANALRYNRMLISINLSSNFITDKGACALAMVLRKIVLTEEELIHRRFLLSERYDETHLEDLRNSAPSPTLSTVSTKSRSGRDNRSDSKRTSDPNKLRKPMAIKNTDKRHRADSDENRPSSPNKNDQKKGKTDGGSGRSPPAHSRRSSTEQGKQSAHGRKKKLAPGTGTTSKKNISMVKEEDEDAIDEDGPSVVPLPRKSIPIQMQHIERENPLLELHDIESHNGEIRLKGNLVLLNLNLSRNYLTLQSANEFLLSIEYQTKLTQNYDVISISSVAATSTDFSGLCRLELKGMNGIPTNSTIYQSLEKILIQKSPSTRFQQIKDREAKEALDQQQQPSVQTSQQTLSEKPRASSSVKSTSQRPTSRLKD